jgi:hypothetical protein
MNRALVKVTTKPPKELASFFADPPLVGGESRADYDNLFSALAAAAKPVDAIAWIYLGDFTNLTWEIKRERGLKQRAVEAARKGIVRGLLMPPPPPPPPTPTLFPGQLMFFDEVEPDPVRAAKVERASEDAEQWASDPKARRRIDKDLAERGYDQAYILARALTDSASDIDTIDQRISTYEYRRNAILREFDRHSESMARRLGRASSEIIDGEFTEAAE